MKRMVKAEVGSGILATGVAHHKAKDQLVRNQMKRWLWVGVMATVIAVPVLSSAAQAGGTGDSRCSNATLNGQYAFGVTAYTPAGTPKGPPNVVAGIKLFDGNGNLTQRDYGGDSLRTTGQTDFSTGETGTYTVNSDCTGSMQIMIPVPGLSTGVIDIMFVISDGGRHIHEVVAEFTPPGYSDPQPTQTSADDWKVASEQNQKE